MPESWFNPTRSESFTNEFTRRLSLFRDEHMLRNVVAAVRGGERVFAVVGSAHVIRQERALQAALRLRDHRRQRDWSDGCEAACASASGRVPRSGSERSRMGASGNETRTPRPPSTSARGVPIQPKAKNENAYSCSRE